MIILIPGQNVKNHSPEQLNCITGGAAQATHNLRCLYIAVNTRKIEIEMCDSSQCLHVYFVSGQWIPVKSARHEVKAAILPVKAAFTHINPGFPGHHPVCVLNPGVLRIIL